MSDFLFSLESKPLNSLILLSMVILGAAIGLIGGNFLDSSSMMLLPLNLQAGLFLIIGLLSIPILLIEFVFPHKESEAILKARKEGAFSSIKLFFNLILAGFVVMAIVLFVVLGVLMVDSMFFKENPKFSIQNFPNGIDPTTLLVLAPFILTYVLNLLRIAFGSITYAIGKNPGKLDLDFNLIIGAMIVFGVFVFSTNIVMGIIVILSGYFSLTDPKTAKLSSKNKHWPSLKKLYFAISALYLISLGTVHFVKELRAIAIPLPSDEVLLSFCYLLFFFLISALVNKMEAFQILIGKDSIDNEILKKYVLSYEILLGISTILLIFVALKSNWLFLILALINVSAAEVSFQQYLNEKLGIKEID
ncbi:hypothetical protein HY989_06970 [Candidatus Micrarchaeota archaeon]|nr:hypothetical protein [Candidatus Micrarchaeota archaeon]